MAWVMRLVEWSATILPATAGRCPARDARIQPMRSPPQASLLSEPTRDDPVARGSKAAIGGGTPTPRRRVGRQVLDDLEAELGGQPASSRRRASGIVAPVGLWKVGTT